MDYDQLKGLIKNTLLKNEPLKTADLKSAAIDQISNDVFPGNCVRLDLSKQNPYEEDVKNKRVIVRGKGVDVPFQGLESEVRFGFHENETALTWIATANAGWKLSTGFPSLQRTICEGIVLSSAAPPRIVLNSHSQAPDVDQGMYFSGTIDINKMTGGLAGALGIDTLKISGPVILRENGSVLQKINFTAPDIAAVDLGIVAKKLKLGFSISNAFIYNTLRERYFVIPYILLGTEIPFEAQGKSRAIPVSVRIADLQSDLRFSADPTQLINAGLDEIKSLAGNVDLKGVKLPDKFRIQDVLKFNEFFFDFNMPAKKVTSIGIEVENAHPWRVFHLDASQQDLIIERATLAFRLFDPFGKAPNTSLTVGGEVAFGNADKDPGVLVLYASYPDWSIQGYLKEGTRLSLAETLQGFLGSTTPVPDLAIDQFDFGLSSGNYAISLDLQGNWKIPFGVSTGVLIEQVGSSIKHQKDEGTEAFAAGRFGIGPVDIYVTAAHPAGSRDGWTFTGSASAGADGLKISDFLDKTVDQLFPGATSGVPAMLANVAIKTIGVDFNTQSKDFHFQTEIDFGPNVRTDLTFSNLHQEGAATPTFERRASGTITVFPGDKQKEFALGLGIDLAPKSKHFVALYNNSAGKTVQLGEVVKALYPDYQGPDLNFGIAIKDGIVGYVSDETQKRSIFALDIGASIDLTSLGTVPLVGQSLSAAKTLKLAVQLIYPALGKDEKFFPADDLKSINELIAVAGPRLPTEQVPTGLSVKTELRLGDSAPIDFKLPISINPGNGKLKDDSKNGGTVTPADSQATEDGVKWFQLDKKFGPLHLQRAGFRFEKGAMTALLDGGLTAFGLEVDLMGLSVTSKLTEVQAPVFGLAGLGLGFSKGGVEIAGALLHLKDEYDGLASVQAEGLRLAAIGSLTTVLKQPSLFLYAVLDYPLGGAPFFYVTGLAGGFGLNQKLVMPPVDQVKDFPLVTIAQNPPTMPTDPSQAGGFIEAQMKGLRTHLAPSLGQYFACAGIQFTSFELLNSFVLVSLSFGHEFELDLLGISTLVVPPQEPSSVPALAVISLQLAASFIPDEGLAIVQGQLTPDSHLFTLDCHLTGGFAFAVWFGSNPYAGDFVVTLGGYHPDFHKPDHYPTVPRIGVNWQISAELSVTGGLYFALTPRALMAGGAMHAIFQIEFEDAIASAEVRAWFILGADFIVYWKPFHYSAHVYIDMGVDVVIHFLGTHDIGFDAGADLEVWGPPFAGRARITFKVIGITVGFNVAFGPAAPAPAPLVWDSKEDPSTSFRQSFLPKKSEQIVSVAIGEGLVRKIEDDKKTWHIINPKDFRVRTHSVIPIKECVWGKKPFPGLASNVDFGINPMHKGSAQVKTSHQITVTLYDKQEPMETQFSLKPICGSVPGGLWAAENWAGEKHSPDINAERLIENVATGFEIALEKTHVLGPTKSIKRGLVAYQTQHMKDGYADHAIAPFTAALPGAGDDPDANGRIWTRIQGEIHANATRTALLNSMGFAETGLDIGEPFTTDAPYAPGYGALTS